MTEQLNPDDFDINSEQPQESAEVSQDLIADLAATQITGKRETANRAGQVAMLKGVPGDLKEIQIASQEPDGRSAADIAAQQHFDKLVAQNEEYLSGVFETAVTPDSVAQYIQEGITQRTAITDARVSPVSTERALIDSVAQSVDSAKRDERAFQIGATNDIKMMLDGENWWDTTTNFLGYMVPFGNITDITDIKDEIRSNPVLDRELSANSIEAMVTSFHTLPPARKEAVWPELQKAVVAAVGTNFLGYEPGANLLKASSLLQQFLSPEGADTLQREATLDAAFGAFDVATVPVLPAKLLKMATLTKAVKADMTYVLKEAGEQTARNNNLIKITLDLNNPEAAVKMNIAAMVDDEAAAAAGVTRQQAMDNALPVHGDMFTPEKANALPAHLAETLNSFMAKASGKVRSMTDESELITIGALSESDRTRVTTTFLEQMERKGEDLLQEGIHMDNVRITSVDERGFSFEYDMLNTKLHEFVPTPKITESGKTVFRAQSQTRPSLETGTVSWRTNEITGTFDQTTETLAEGTAASLGRSPAAWSVVGKNGVEDFGNAVKQAVQLKDLAVATQGRVENLWLDANANIKGLSNVKGRAILERVELEGDGFLNPESQLRGRVFNQQELSARGLTDPKFVEAYYKRRIFADTLHRLQNFVTRRELELEGFRETKILGQRVVAKMFDTPAAAISSAKKKAGFKAMQQDTKEVVELTEELIQAEYAKGKRLVRTREDFNTSGAGDMAAGGERVEYVFINNVERMKALPEQVLAYHPGYVPKINEGIEFVLQHHLPYPKAGAPSAGRTVALRAFASRKQLEAFQAKLIDDQIIKMDKAGESAEVVAALREQLAKQYRVTDGSKMGQVERMENTLSGTEGLYTGTRAKDDLLMGLKGEELKRVNPTEAFGRYMSHIGEAISKNEWRIGMEQKWLNTVRSQAENLPGVEIKGFSTTQMSPDTPLKKALLLEQQQISAWNRVPSGNENMFQQWIQSMHDWALLGGNRLGLDKSSVSSLLWLKHSNPIMALKAANMHIFLGSLNPAQIYVQASAATVALSLQPIKKWPGIANQAWKFHMLDNIQDGTALGKAYSLLQRNNIMTAQEVEAHIAWKKTGLYESVRSNADMTVMSSTGLGLSSEVMRKASNISLYTYRAGELMNRRVSFSAALSEFLSKNPARVGKELTQKELKGLLEQTNVTMFELNGGNRAWWQGGRGTSATQQVVGQATQFMQVMGKTMELIAKSEGRGGFTGAQKARIGIGQAALFGTAGVPLIGSIAAGVSDWIGSDLSPAQANAVNQGAVGVFVREFLGADIDIANRAALGAGVFNTIKDVFTSDDPMWIKAFGVGSEAGSRTLAAYQALKPLFLADNRSSEDLTTARMEQGIRALFSIPSTGRNLLNGWMMQNHDQTLDRRKRLINTKDFALATEIGAALGFRPTADTRTRMIQMDNRDFEDIAREAADRIITMQHNWVYLHDRNEEHGQLLLDARQYLLESLNNDALINRVNNLVARRVFEEPISLHERELKKFYERTASDEIAQGMMLDTGIVDSLFNEQAITQPFADIGE
ncbi:MAG: hypothetical protein V3S69_00075 [Dehalococcoidales bacterium]